MAQGRSTKIISTIKWIQTGRLSIKNSLSKGLGFLVSGFWFHTVEFEGLVASNFEGYVTKSATHKALKIIV